jgi:hypothetical protein
MLFNKFETGLLVKVSRSVESFKSSKVYPFETLAPAKIDRRIYKSIADSFSPKGIGHDEPPEMRPLAFSMNPVDDNGTFDTAIHQRSPETVAVLVIAPEKLREFSGHFSLKKETESPMFVVVGTMEFSDSADRAGDIASCYLNLPHKNPFFDLRSIPTIIDYPKESEGV